MAGNRVAVVGVGQTKYAAVRGDVSLPGLLREAVFRALDDAHLTMDDIDAVVVGKAPDFFEGMMMPESYLAEALGAVGKPLFRVHTAGSVGGSTAIVAASHVQSGVHDRVLTIAWQQQSVSEAMWALSFPIPFQQQLVAGAGGYFAPFIREYIRRSNAPDEIGILVALKDRLNALKNPYAHLHEPDITFESIQESFMLWEPIRYSETCPGSDGAIALVLASEDAAEASAASSGVPPAWIHGTAMRSEPATASGRDQVNPDAGKECAADV
jgi:acetyl-CoA C-acetyltransferase